MQQPAQYLTHTYVLNSFGYPHCFLLYSHNLLSLHSKLIPFSRLSPKVSSSQCSDFPLAMTHNLTLQVKEREMWRLRWLRNLLKDTELISGKGKRKTHNSWISVQHTRYSSLFSFCLNFYGIGGQGTSFVTCPFAHKEQPPSILASLFLLVSHLIQGLCSSKLRDKKLFYSKFNEQQEQTVSKFTKSSIHLYEKSLK